MVEQQLEQIEGVVEDIIYENEDNGYTVFEISGGGVLTVVCGIVGELHAGESVICRGRYENHATYGRQFHAQECETDMPKDLEAVYAFLASRSLPYIGARTADKIIDMFGAEALEVIANDPARLTKIPGISPDKADRIQQEFKRMFGMRELIAYLAQFEISPPQGHGGVQGLWRGSNAGHRVKPLSAVRRAAAAGLPPRGQHRPVLPHGRGLCPAAGSCPAAHFAPQRGQRPHLPAPGTAAGHCLQLHPAAAGKAGPCTGPLHRNGRTARRENVRCGTKYIYLPDLLAAEQDIADRLNLLAKRGKIPCGTLDKNIQILELTQGFAYAPLQREAIRKAMTENCLVLTGGPGTGKTTTVNAILQLLENHDRVALCAPTGRAAKRLSELTGRKASTIHRLLEVDYTGGVVSFIHNDKNLLKCDVVILDEMSMVDVKLFQASLRRCATLPYYYGR